MRHPPQPYLAPGPPRPRAQALSDFATKLVSVRLAYAPLLNPLMSFSDGPAPNRALTWHAANGSE